MLQKWKFPASKPALISLKNMKAEYQRKERGTVLFAPSFASAPEFRFGTRVSLRHPSFASGARGPFRYVSLRSRGLIHLHGFFHIFPCLSAFFVVIKIDCIFSCPSAFLAAMKKGFEKDVLIKQAFMVHFLAFKVFF